MEHPTVHTGPSALSSQCNRKKHRRLIQSSLLTLAISQSETPRLGLASPPSPNSSRDSKEQSQEQHHTMKSHQQENRRWADHTHSIPCWQVPSRVTPFPHQRILSVRGSLFLTRLIPHSNWTTEDLRSRNTVSQRPSPKTLRETVKRETESLEVKKKKKSLLK